MRIREPRAESGRAARVEAAGGNNLSQLLIITLLLDATGEALHALRTACIPNSSSSSSMETDETRHGVRARAQTEVTVTRRW